MAETKEWTENKFGTIETKDTALLHIEEGDAYIHDLYLNEALITDCYSKTVKIMSKDALLENLRDHLYDDDIRADFLYDYMGEPVDIPVEITYKVDYSVENIYCSQSGVWDDGRGGTDDDFEVNLDAIKVDTGDFSVDI